MTSPNLPLSSIHFRTLLAPEEEPTGDGRIIGRDSLSHRPMPLPGMFARTLTSGHQGAVTVSRLDDVEYVPGRGWVGSGVFLNPRIVPEVVEAVYLAQQGLIRPSVDLQPDAVFEIVPHPRQPDDHLYRVVQGRIMGFTFVPHPAFEQTEVWVTSGEDEALLASAGVNFAVNTNFWRNMEVAERETEFNYDAAVPRLVEWSGGKASKFRQAFLYQTRDGDPTSTESYLLMIADVIDGTLTLIPRAVYSAAVFLSGGHGGLPQVPEDDQEQLRGVVTDIYDFLRERFADSRVRPPWQRGGRQGERGAHSANQEGGTVMTQNVFQSEDEDCGNLDTPDAGELNTAARRCAAERGWAMEDGSYPIRSREMHGEADLDKAVNAVGRGNAPHDEIRRHIMKRARALGLTEMIPDNWNRDGSLKEEAATAVTGFQSEEEQCPEGHVRHPETGECVPRNDDAERRSEESEYTPGEVKTFALVADGGIPVRPPKWMFANPALPGPTALTVDEDGHVYGHLATWGTCHEGVRNRCVTPPHSSTNYALFKNGEVICADGSRHTVGKITLGTGHADPQLGLIPAAEHYDNTGSTVAVVDTGEDQHGIWFSGTLVPGVSQERIAELRRSQLSGDWRRRDGNLELVAALAVNSPGFPVLRASGEDEEIVEALVAANPVPHEPVEVDPPSSEPVETDREQRFAALVQQSREDRVQRLLGEGG